MISNVKKKEKISISVALVWCAIILDLIQFMYQYINQPYVQSSLFSSNMTTLSNNNVISSSINLIVLACFFAMGVLSLFKVKKINISMLYVYIMLSFGVIWTVISLMGKYDIIDAINSSTSPIILIMSVCMFSGYDDKVWETLRKAVFFSSVIYTAIAGYEIVRFLAKYGFSGRLTVSGAMYAAVTAIFLTYINILLSEEYLRKYKLIFAAQIAVLLFTVVVLQSRSWLVHMLFLLCLFIYKLSRTYKYKNAILVGLIFLIVAVFVVCWSYILVISGNLIDRLDADSRTGQLQTFFNQVSFWDLVKGGGIGASYVWQNRSYLFLDNLVLLTMFKFGIVPIAAYLLLLLKPITYGITHKKSPVRKGVLFLLAWLAMMLGFGIYISYANNLYNYLIYIVIGRMIYISQCEKEEQKLL